MKKLPVYLSWTLLLAGCLPAATTSPRPVTPAPQFKVIAYVYMAEDIQSIQYDKLTHINYAFLLPNADGTLKDVDDPAQLQALVEASHRRGVKVLISVGGWGLDRQFEALAANPATRTVFVQELVDYAARYRLDGVDIDWEYPQAGVSDGNYLALIRELRAALPANLLLTTAVAAYGENAAGIPTEAFAELDFVNLMVYDMSTEAHATMAMAEEALAYWADRGLPRQKMVLGVPFYSRPSWVPYKKLVENNSAATRVDNVEFDGRMEYYNGIPTMQKKTRLALEQASGIMFWAWPYDATDDYSLLAAIDRIIHP